MVSPGVLVFNGGGCLRSGGGYNSENVHRYFRTIDETRLAVAATGGRVPSTAHHGDFVDANTLESCQKILDYEFVDPSLLELALTHSSVAPTRGLSNERLEFLGDAVLGLVVCHDLFMKNEDLQEGDMTKIKSLVVSRFVCAKIAEESGITRLLSLGRGLQGPGGVPQSISAGVLEAIIGAVFLDGGLEPARKFILDQMRSYLNDAIASEHQLNYKSMLQQHVQRNWGATPEYLVLDEKGPDHSKCFEIAVNINGRHFPSAWGKNKKDAEQEAARKALVDLNILKDEALEK